MQLGYKALETKTNSKGFIENLLVASTKDMEYVAFKFDRGNVAALRQGDMARYKRQKLHKNYHSQRGKKPKKKITLDGPVLANCRMMI
jgi:hypothetical protein